MTTETATAPEKMITIRESFLDQQIADLSKREYERGERDGRANARAIHLGDDYGTDSAVIILSAKSRRELTGMVRERNRRTSGGPGQVYMYSCAMLRAYKRNGEWLAVCLASTHYDV